MCERMKGRKFLKIPQISLRVKDGDIEGDWVTVGVIVSKLAPRDTAKVRIDQWMDEWMNGRMNRWMSGWMNG